VTANDYLRRVDFCLRDLPWRMRRELLAELRGHLDELPEGTDLVSRLGPPEQYAWEMRSAAGLERRRGPIAFLRARRLRNVILTVIALTLLGVVIGALAWIGSYQPLAPGMGFQYPAGVRPAAGADLEEVHFRQGGPFEAGVSFVNDGRFTVRVLSVSLESGEPFSDLPLKARLYVAGPMTNSGGYPRPHRRFHPFDLEPGQVAFLVLRGAYDAPCRPQAMVQDYWELGGFEVRFGFLWRTGTAEIDLPPQLQINGPKGMECNPGPPPP
jgi:hypothetical protein